MLCPFCNAEKTKVRATLARPDLARQVPADAEDLLARWGWPKGGSIVVRKRRCLDVACRKWFASIELCVYDMEAFVDHRAATMSNWRIPHHAHQEEARPSKEAPLREAGLQSRHALLQAD